MKRTLEKAPLVHTLIQLRFSEVPSLTSISTEMLKSLHMRMIDEGFQDKIQSQAEILDLVFDAATQQLRHHKQTKMRTLFRASGEFDIVEVSEASITLKSTNYKSFEDFYGKFRSLLTACITTIDGLNKALIKSVSLRYVDVIVPTNNSTLSNFVSPEVLPPTLNMITDLKHLQGGTQKVVETKPGQVLIVNFEELQCRDKCVHKVLPDNLMEPDPKCGLVINGQVEWLQVNSETYGILDVDHTHNFIGSPMFNIEQIESATNELYQHANEVFWGIITQEAKQAWGYKEV